MLVISLFIEVLFDFALRLIFLCSDGGSLNTNFTCSASAMMFSSVVLIYKLAAL